MGATDSAITSGIDRHTDFYKELGQLFELEDGGKGVYFTRLDN